MSRWPLVLASMITCLLGCGATPAARSTLPEAEHTAAAAIPARLVRQPSISRDLRAALYVRVGGATRMAGGDGSHLWVTDPFSRVAYAREAIPFALQASLDPALTTVCLEMREPRGGAPTDVGAFDLVHQTWLWRERLIAEGVDGIVARVVAGPDVCGFVVRTRDGDRLALRTRTAGTPIASDAPVFDTLTDTTAMWTDDHGTLLLVHPASAGNGERGLYVDVRDGRTMAQRAALWARCVEVDDTVRLTLEDRIEDEARRAYLEQVVPELLGPCSGGPEVPEDTVDLRPLPSPWAPLSDDVVAVHDETGLYFWDHVHRASPRRIEAPALVRFDDIDDHSRPHDLVIPPDASWVGIIRADGTMARRSVRDGEPLSDVVLPRLARGGALSAEDAEWQVFAGARDRLLAIHGGDGHRHAYVGDVEGHWASTAAPVFPAIVQAAEHEDTTRTWLLSDPHYGPSRVEESSGALLASFSVTDTASRYTTAMRSPDGRELFVGVAPATDDTAGGLYFLDATTLEPVRRFDAAPFVSGPATDVTWTPEGVILAMYPGFVVRSAWARIDPLTGAGEIVAEGPMSIARSSTHRGSTHVVHAFDGGVLVSGADRAASRWLRIVEGGAVIEESNGDVWCEGAGCALYRCVVGALEPLPADDPRCAAQRIR